MSKRDTNRRRHHEQLSAGIGYEAGQPVVTTEPDYGDELEIGDPGIHPHSVTRAELEKTLGDAGLAEIEITVAVASLRDRKSTRDIAEEVGKSHVWVSKLLKRLLGLVSGGIVEGYANASRRVFTLLQAIKRRDEEIERRKQGFLAENPGGHFWVRRDPTLSDAIKGGCKRLDSFFNGTDAGYVGHALGEMGISASWTERKIQIALITVCPDMLLNPDRADLLHAFVDTLKLARYGNRKTSAPARKALAVLLYLFSDLRQLFLNFCNL